MSVLMFLCVARMGNAAHAKARDSDSQNARKRDFFGSQDAPLEISVSWFKWREQHQRTPTRRASRDYTFEVYPNMVSLHVGGQSVRGAGAGQAAAAQPVRFLGVSKI